MLSLIKCLKDLIKQAVLKLSYKLAFISSLHPKAWHYLIMEIILHFCAPQSNHNFC